MTTDDMEKIEVFILALAIISCAALGWIKYKK